MKKILFVIPTLSSGGAERFVSNLSNYLVTKNYKIRILMLEKMEPYYYLDERVEIINSSISIDRTKRITSKLKIIWSLIFSYVTIIKKELKNYSPDIVIPFLPQADIATFFANFPKRNFKLICSERNDPNERSIIVKFILKYIYKNIDWLVCQSSVVVDFYKYISPDKKVVIANPINPQIIPDFVESESNYNIVAAGRLDFQKNFTLLINSFADAFADLPQGTTLTIYGEGPERRKLEELIKMRGMSENINLPGLCNQLLNEIKDSALFVMSSNFEGFPNALLEAMVVGLPVISTDFPTGTARTLIHEKNGIIVPVNDQKSMRNAIIKIMNNKKIRDTMRINNRKMLEMFSIASIAEKWECLFNTK